MAMFSIKSRLDYPLQSAELSRLDQRIRELGRKRRSINYSVVTYELLNVVFFVLFPGVMVFKGLLMLSFLWLTT